MSDTLLALRMEPEKLGHFSAEGGVGTCIAVDDYIAEHSDNLMFLQVRCQVQLPSA